MPKIVLNKIGLFFKNILIEFYYNIYLFIIFIFHFHPYCVLITLLHSFCQGNSSDVKLAGPFLSGMQALWSRDLPPAIKNSAKTTGNSLLSRGGAYKPFCQGNVWPPTCHPKSATQPHQNWGRCSYPSHGHSTRAQWQSTQYPTGHTLGSHPTCHQTGS